MKKIILLLILIIPALNSCFEPIAGNGNIVEKELSFHSFISVTNSSPADVYIIPSAEHKVIFRIDENLYDRVDFSTVAQQLIIKAEDGIDPTTFEVEVYIQDISELTLSGSGNIFANDDINQDASLWLANEGSGNIDIKYINSNSSYFILDGSGNILVNQINNNTEFYITNEGSGNIVFDKLDSKEIYMEAQGSGNIVAKSGNASSTNYFNEGSGDINFINCGVDDADILSNGSGDIYLWAINQMQVVINGSGDVIYKGNPNITKQVIKGSGKLKRY